MLTLNKVRLVMMARKAAVTMVSKVGSQEGSLDVGIRVRSEPLLTLLLGGGEAGIEPGES